MQFLADENFSVPILRGLRRRQPDLDIVHIHELGMDETPDPDILVWAAAENRVVITHDVKSMPEFAPSAAAGRLAHARNGGSPAHNAHRPGY